MTTVDEGRAALERGRHVVVVLPPAPDQAGDLWRLLAPPSRAGSNGPSVVIACPDESCAAAWAAAARPDWQVHAVSGLSRTTRTLASHPPDALAASVADLMALLSQSALKLEPVTTVVIAWPEQLVAADAVTELDTFLGAVPEARRIVLSWNPTALGDFLERHARRAAIVGELPVDADGRPAPPLGAARYAVGSSLPEHRATLLRDTLDSLAPARPLVWHGGEINPPLPSCDAVICLTLPTRAQFTALAGLGAGAPVVFVTGGQLPYLRSIAAPLTPLPLPSNADRARDRAAALRERIKRRIETGSHDAELALLDPLFERYDPAEVAAAVLALLEEGGSRKEEAANAMPGSAAPAGWSKVFLNVGKKDRASAKDLVGALIREVGLEKTQIGRIDVKETFSVVEVSARVVEKAVQGLGGVTVRGRRVAARLDRYV